MTWDTEECEAPENVTNGLSSKLKSSLILQINDTEVKYLVFFI